MVYVIHACFTVMYSLSSEGNEIMGENFCCLCRLHCTIPGLKFNYTPKLSTNFF